MTQPLGWRKLSGSIGRHFWTWLARPGYRACFHAVTVDRSNWLIRGWKRSEHASAIPGPLRPPVLAIVADLSAAVLVVIGTIVLYRGRTRFSLLGLGLLIRSPWLPYLSAGLLIAARRWRVPHHSLLDQAVTRDSPPVAPSWLFLVSAFLLLTLLTVVGTYPQILRMRDGVNDVGDPLLNAWALAWVAHQLPIAPAHLFDANIFYPEKGSLAFSETLLVPALAVAPLLWAGTGPILAYNIVFLSAIVFSGLAVTRLVHELTGDAIAAIIAGIIFDLLPFRMDHLGHLQLQQTEWIPLALWALHRVMRSGRPADAAKLGVFVACQMLSCMYFGLFLVPYVAVVAFVLLVSETRAASLEQVVLLTYERVLALAFAGAVCLFLVAPAGRAYLTARQVVGERSAAAVADGSATLRNYLSTADSNVMYGRWSQQFGSAERHLFPGVVAVSLALLALWPPLSKVRLAYGVALLFAFDASLGFNGLSYRLLWEYVLPFRGLRVPARIGLMVGFSLAVLAGHGVARLNGAIQSKPGRWALAFALSLMILGEYRSKRLELTTVPEVPPSIYADLLQDRRGVADVAIVELPIAREDPTYMYYSTFHWQYLVNGYSGFFPPGFERIVPLLTSFPDEVSLDALRGHSVRYVVIHGELFRPEEYARTVAAADGSAWLQLVARRPWDGREISLYRMAADPPHHSSSRH